MLRLKKFSAFVFSGYLIVTIMLYFLQEKLIFLPTKLPVDYEYAFNQPFEELFLEAKDGSRLNGIHFLPEQPKGVILYFHGNAGDLSRWGSIATFFVEKGYAVVVMDYRTYGKSTGKLSEEALYSDAQLFYDYTRARYKEEEIIVYGRSLGTGIASKITSLNSPSKLLLETPYYSLEELGQSRFPWLPVKLLSRFEIKTYEFLSRVNCPVVIFHGTEDRVVPIGSGRKLFEAIPGEKKRMYVIDGGRHNNLINFEAYQTAVKEALTRTD